MIDYFNRLNEISNEDFAKLIKFLRYESIKIARSLCVKMKFERLKPDDIVQIVMEKIIKKRNATKNMGFFPTEEKIKGQLFKMIKSAIVDEIRRHKNRNTNLTDLNDEANQFNQLHNDDDEIVRKKRVEIFMHLFNKFRSTECHELLDRKYFSGLTISAMIETWPQDYGNLKEKTLEKKIQRCKNKFKSLIKLDW